MTAESTPVGGLDYVAAKSAVPEGATTLFKGVKPAKGDRLVVFGWAMAESLSSGKLPK